MRGLLYEPIGRLAKEFVKTSRATLEDRLITADVGRSKAPSPAAARVSSLIS